MLVSRRVGQYIDTKGNSSIIRYVPLFLLASVVLFALFEGISFWALLFIYILLSISFTILQSSVSNELSRILEPAQIGSGLGLYQLLQFFSGAFGVAMSAAALSWQEQLSLTHAYSNIYWGLSMIVLLAILCSFLYTKSSGRALHIR